MMEKEKMTYVIYGSTDWAIWCEDWIHRAYGWRPEYVVDKNPCRKEIDGIPVMGFAAFKQLKKQHCFVIVAEEEFSEKEYRRKLSSELSENGAFVIFDAKRLVHAFWPDWYVWIKEHSEDLSEVSDLFSDEISKQTLIDYLSVYIHGTPFNGIVFPEKYKYWGIDSDDYRMFNLNEDEVILNLGGCSGDTIFQYITNGFPFQKIISVEGREQNCQYIKRSASLLDKKIAKRIQVDCVLIDESNSIDRLYHDERISLIEMDIEGAEMAALKGAEGIIRRNRPILSICAYHKMDDLVTISRYITKVCPQYRYMLRKYPSTFFPDYQGVMQVNELVLYAIPEERFVLGRE